jgi:hypothetical protein
MSDEHPTNGMTKREFVKKASYVVPAVLTLAAAPSFASAGSNSKSKKPKHVYKEIKKTVYKKK